MLPLLRVRFPLRQMPRAQDRQPSRHPRCGVGSTLVFGFPVFCLVCPIGLTFATVLLVMRLFAFGDATWTVVAFPAIIALEILLLPKWCQRFCPLARCFRCSAG